MIINNVLINISNHASEKWGEDQKKGFTNIIDIIPSVVNPYATTEEVIKQAEVVFNAMINKLNELDMESTTINVFVAGEQTLITALQKLIKNELINVKFVTATTDRVVSERVLPDGTVEKTSEFKFVQWRELPI